MPSELSLRAWDERIPPFPWGDPQFSERLLREHLSQAHDLASRRTAIIEAQVEWLDNHLPPNSTLLDGGCGPGLHALALAARGHRVTGIDIGPAVIRYAQAEAAARNVAATFAVADLRTMVLAPHFDAMLLLYGHIHTFRPEEAWLLLRRLRQQLAPGGRVLIEARHEENWDCSSYRTWWRGEDDFYSPGPYLALYEHLWDEEATAEVEHYQILHDDGTLEQYALTERRLMEDEWRLLLKSVGFTKLQFIREGWPSEKPGGWMLVEASA
jgi:SAM-dependent methyltransferase